MKVTIPFSYYMNTPSLFNHPEITVRNKQGNKVRILCTDANIPGFPVVGVVEHDKPDDNYTGTYSEEGRFTLGESDEDLVVEVDNDAITKKTGVDLFEAVILASTMFGDLRQYSPEELDLIAMISLAFVAG